MGAREKVGDRRQAGFTLLELLVTLIVIAVVLEPNVRRVTVRAGGPDGEVRETRTLSGRLRVDGIGGLSVGFDPAGSSTGGEFRVAANDGIWRVTVDPITSRVRVARQ